MLDAAARQAKTNISDFVRRKALEAAELDLMDHGRIVIPAADWARFEAWIGAPARAIPGLKDLAAHRPAWRD